MRETVGTWSADKPLSSYSAFPSPEHLGWPAISIEEFYDQISEFSLHEVIPLIARLNVAFQAGRVDDVVFQANLVRTFFSPDDHRMLSGFDSPVAKVALAPLHFRLMMLALIKVGQRGRGLTLENLHDRFRFGRLLLYAPSLLSPTIPVPSEPSVEQLLSLELSSIHQGFRQSTRSQDEILTKGVISRLYGALGLDEAIRQRHSFTTTEYQTALLSLWQHFGKQTPAYMSATAGSTLDFEYLMGLIRAPKALGDYLLENHGFNLSEGASDSGITLFEMGLLSDRPLAYRDHRIICLDLDFLQRKAARGLWNLAQGEAKADMKGVIGDKAGALFEEVCNDLIAVAKTGRNSAWIAPKSLLQGKARPDALFVDGSDAIVFEYKSNTLPLAAAYGTDPAALGTAIMDKFVAGTAKNAQGFSQCANHLRQMLKEPKKFHLSTVKKVVPCLVTIEESMTTSFCYAYAVSMARNLFKEFGDLIGDPVILNVEDLAALAERSKTSSLPQMLLDIGRGNIIAEGSTKNMIMRRWPEELLEQSGTRIELSRPTDFFDQAIGHLGAEEDLPVKRCTTCGGNLLIVAVTTPINGLPYCWWCDTCQCSLAAIEGDLDAHEASRMAAKERYLQP